MSPSISEGLYRLSDSFVLSAGSSSNCYTTVSRSITQFAEEKSLSSIYSMVRLISFQMTLYSGTIFTKVDSDNKNLSMGIMAMGTAPITTVTAPSSAVQVLAQADSRTVQFRNRVVPYVFRSTVQAGGFAFTAFASETSYAFAGSPGTILVANVLAGSFPEGDVAYGIITAVYQLGGRTA